MKSVDGVKDSIINEIAKRNYRPEKNRRFQHNIVFEHVGYAYDSFELKDFNCTFEKGKKYAITGMSGTGKSTILQLMTGNLEPASGKIFVDGEEISYDKCLNLMGYVRQQSNIYRENFWDNVTVFGSYEMESFLQKYIPEHRWQYLTNTPDCGNLSGGEQQLISFVRALSSGRDILVLDEPFSALDKELELEICRNLVRQQEKTVIMITHNEDEKFLALFDEVIMMEK